MLHSTKITRHLPGLIQNSGKPLVVQRSASKISNIKETGLSRPEDNRNKKNGFQTPSGRSKWNFNSGFRQFFRAYSSNDSSDEPAKFSHLDETGKASMVSVADKKITRRCAVASSRLNFSNGPVGTRAANLLANHALTKGDAFTVAQIAGIQAAKSTSNFIPLCHQIPLSHVDVNFRLIRSTNSDDVEAVEVTSRVEAEWRTGVEMEALSACAVASLTLYDMCKAVDKGMTINALQLELKSGGRSGTYERDSDNK